MSSDLHDDDAAAAALAPLRDVAPPPSLVAAVMQRIAEPRRETLWQWLRRRRRIELRLSPLGLGLLLAGAAVAVALVGGLPMRSGAGTVVIAPSSSREPAPVVVRFVLTAQGAHHVTLAGDFNAWDPEATVLAGRDDGTGTFTANVPLRPGAHEYMFVVDGRWVTDPLADERRPDGFGRENSLLRI